VAWSLENLGKVSYRMKAYTDAHSRYEAALNIYRKLEETDGIAWSLLSLGKIAYREKRYGEAVAFVEEGKAIYETKRDTYMIACATEHLARVAYTVQDYSRAKRLICEGIALFERVREKKSVADLKAALNEVQQILDMQERASKPREDVSWSGPRRQSDFPRLPQSMPTPLGRPAAGSPALAMAAAGAQDRSYGEGVSASSMMDLGGLEIPKVAPFIWTTSSGPLSDDDFGD
jgi:tetratricopeptide (TPR) repeat protein